MNFWNKYPELSLEMDEVENLIRKTVKSRNALLTEIATDLILSGGKRLRPAFVMLSAGFGNCDRDKMISMAGAVEMLHSATLVHDDIIDNANLRRGKQTIFSKWGADMAVYTGDFLFTRAVLMLSKGFSQKKLDKICLTIKTMCEGEVDQYQVKYNLASSVSDYLKRIHRKTAILFAASCFIGAIESECEKKTAWNLIKFGQAYGMAFQIRDDLNDFMWTEKESGKPVVKDIREGIFTLPVIYSLRKPNIRKSLIDILKKEKEMTENDVMEVVDIVKSSGAIEQTQSMFDKYYKRAEKAINALPEHKNKEILKVILAML